MGWRPETVFICYALETVVIGLFNVFKLIAVFIFGLPPKPDETGINGLGIIPFFIIHYYFFVFVQLSIFFSGSGVFFNPDLLVRHITNYLGQQSFNASLLMFIASNMLLFISDFLLSGKHLRRTMTEQMFEPYPRIFVQQFVVILGGFIFAVTGNAFPVLIVFVIIKTYADLLFKDFDITAWAKEITAKGKA